MEDQRSRQPGGRQPGPARLLAGLCLLLLLALPAAGQPTCADCDELGNGVTVLDSLEAARIAAGLETPAGTQMCTCDVNSTGAIDVVDALLMAQIASGLPVILDCDAACLGSCPGTVARGARRSGTCATRPR